MQPMLIEWEAATTNMDRQAVLAGGDEEGKVWLTTVALPLPPNHNLPGGFIIPCEGCESVAEFIALLHQMMGTQQTAGTEHDQWEWLNDPLTNAWINAAVPTEVFSPNEPMYKEHWEFFLSAASMTVADHMRWVHPLLASSQGITVLWWLSDASNIRETTRDKIRRFIVDAHADYVAEPAPLGRPTSSGAAFLFTALYPETARWKSMIPYDLFRGVSYLPPSKPLVRSRRRTTVRYTWQFR